MHLSHFLCLCLCPCLYICIATQNNWAYVYRKTFLLKGLASSLSLYLSLSWYLSLSMYWPVILVLNLSVLSTVNNLWTIVVKISGRRNPTEIYNRIDTNTNSPNDDDDDEEQRRKSNRRIYQNWTQLINLWRMLVMIKGRVAVRSKWFNSQSLGGAGSNEQK